MTPFMTGIVMMGGLCFLLGVTAGLVLAARLLRWWGSESSALMDSVDALVAAKKRGGR